MGGGGIHLYRALCICLSAGLFAVGCGGDTSIFGSAGSGSTATMIHERLPQVPYDVVDILWVMDNTTSMAAAQSILAEEAGGYYDALLSQPVDFQLGVIHTEFSADDGGRLLGEPWIISVDTPDGKAHFQSNFIVGNDALGANQGLAALESALSAPKIDGMNQGFLRKNADLHVYIISDGDDASTLHQSGFLRSVDDFTAFLTQLKDGDISRVRAFAAVGPPNGGGCQSEQITATAAERYAKLAVDTGGAVIAVCNTNGQLSIPRITMDPLIQDFQLRHEPIVGSVQLFFDEKPLPAAAYIEKGKRVEILDHTYLPDYGQALEARYLAILPAEEE